MLKKRHFKRVLIIKKKKMRLDAARFGKSDQMFGPSRNGPCMGPFISL
jgi:hypothetical protein